MDNKITNLSSRQHRQLFDQNLYNKERNFSENISFQEKYTPLHRDRNNSNYLNNYRGQFIEDVHKEESNTMRKRKRSSKLEKPNLLDYNNKHNNKHLEFNRGSITKSRKKLSIRSNKKNKISLESMKTRLSNITETQDSITHNEKINKKKFNNVNDFMQNLTKKFLIKQENQFNPKGIKLLNEQASNVISDPRDLRITSTAAGGRESANLTDRENLNKKNYKEKVINQEKLCDISNYRKQDIIIEDKNIEDSSNFSFKKYGYELPQSSNNPTSDYIEIEKNLENLESPQETPNLGIQYSENNNFDITESKLNGDIEIDSNVKPFNEKGNSVHNGSLFKKLKFKLNNKINKQKFSEKISIVTEKVFEKIIPQISLDTPFQAYEIKLDYNENHDILNSEIKPKAFDFSPMNDYQNEAPQSGVDDCNLGTIKEETEEHYEDEFCQREENVNINKNELPNEPKKEKFLLRLPRNISYQNVDVFLYIKSTLVIFIFVIVFYNYVKRGNSQIDQKKSLIYFLVPTISIAIIFMMYSYYTKSDIYKLQRIKEYLKDYIIEQGKSISKDNLVQVLSEEFMISSTDIIQTRIFNKIVDDFSLDYMIEDFIDNENDNSLSWRRKKTIFEQNEYL